MFFYFTDVYGNPVVYNVQTPDDAWVQKKGQNTNVVLRSSCWMRMGAIGGVEDVPQLTEIQIHPSKDNDQTIGVKYVVKRGDKYFIGFGSSNDFSVVKNVNVYDNKDGSKKEVVSGNGLHALEMATKRAKVVAIATALGFDHNEVGEVVESVDFIINPQLRNKKIIGYKHSNSAELAKISRSKVIGAGSADHEQPTSQLAKPAVPTTTTSAAAKPTNHEQPASQPAKPTPSASHEQPVNQPAKPVATTKPVASATPATPTTTATPAASAPKPESKKSNDDPSEFVMPFGKYKGKALITILSEDSGYIKWLGENTDDQKIKEKVRLLLEKLPNLANQAPPSSGSTPASSFKDKLKEFWKTRGYEPKTEVKAILEKALNEENLSYGAVSEEKAEKLYNNREAIFPIKTTEAPSKAVSGDNTQDSKAQGLIGKASCCVCGSALTEPEVKVSLKKNKELNDRMMCFKHIRVAAPDTEETIKECCEKCSKTLDEQELNFIKEYDSAKLCAVCQAE